MKEKPIDFRPPPNLLEQVGQTVAPGTHMELMTTFVSKEDGRWCIASVEGVPFPGYDAEGNPTSGEQAHMDGENSFAKRYSAAMSEPSARTEAGGY